jgi:hypothetical protein
MTKRVEISRSWWKIQSGNAWNLISSNIINDEQSREALLTVCGEQMSL